MERLCKLLEMKEYIQAQQMIEKFEERRIYCGHGKEHARDVARIAYMISLEEKTAFDKEMIYVMAYMHDMGRAYEYQDVCSHESGSIVMALNWLPKCGFNEQEIEQIVEAIKTHRQKEQAKKQTLGALLYRADKLSRDCFCCRASDTCKWPPEAKNKQIIY